MPSSAGSSDSGSGMAATNATAAPGGETVADALVIFGITGDLAKVMTFRSLYRLERRGLLACPIVGVAAEDWTVAHLREHVRECIEGTGERWTRPYSSASPRGSSYVSGDFNDAATYERVKGAVGQARNPVFYLEIPPFLFGSVIDGSPERADPQRARRRGEALRSRPRLRTRAGRGNPPLHR